MKNILIIFLLTIAQTTFALDLGSLGDKAKSLIKKEEPKKEEVKKEEIKKEETKPIKIDESPEDLTLKQVMGKQQKPKLNTVSLLAGYSPTDVDVKYSNSEYQYKEKWSLVYGLDYTRKNLATVFDQNINLSAQYITNKTILGGIGTTLGGIDLSLMAGFGNSSYSAQTNNDPYAPVVSKDIKKGIVGGAKVNIPMSNRFGVVLEGLSNKTFIGGIGFSF